MLHDIGHYINTIDHHKHGYYLLKHHTLIGLLPTEQEIVANLVLYHRKQSLTVADENLKTLSMKDRLIIIKLCALLADDWILLSGASRRDLEQRSADCWELNLVVIVSDA
jgi:exopolyphosphatase/pppGpp-phosphohydrolase